MRKSTGSSWPDTFIEENNLTQYISALRKVLGDDRHGQRYIETVARRGYRFLAPVRQVRDEGPDLIVENRTSVRVVVKEEKEEREEEITVRLDKAPVSSLAQRLHSNAFTRYLFVSLVLIAIVGSVYFVQTRLRQAPALALAKPVVHSIAVLPFKLVGATDKEDYLGAGFADMLIARLSHVKQISVRSARAVQSYNGSGQRDLVAIARELNVDAVLDGEIQKSNERIRVTVQLVSARDGDSLWAERFDEEFKDIFDAQDAITMRVARDLAPVLTKEETQQLAKRYTENAAAYEAYLKGRYFWSKRTTEGIRKGIEYFQEAIDKDPDFALGYVGLADAYLIDNPSRAQSVLRKALELDDTLGEAHASLGFNRMFYQRAWDDAEREFKLAVELSPNYAIAHQWYANYLAVRGRLAEAKAEMQKALELDPLSPNMHADLGQIHYFAHEYDAAIGQCGKALEIDPDFLFAHQYLFAAYAQKGMYREALEEFLNAPSKAGYTPVTVTAFRNAYAESGWPGFLRARLQFWKQRRYNYPVHMAIVYAELGDKERAIEQLERAYDEGDFFLAFIKVEPMLDDLRSDPRFGELLVRMKLAT